MHGIKKNGHRKLKISAKLDQDTLELPLEVTVEETKRPICAKCKINAVYAHKSAPMHTICEPCYWAYLDSKMWPRMLSVKEARTLLGIDSKPND